MDENLDSEDVNVEDRIIGEFMTQLQSSDVDFEITEIMEGQLDKNDFGGDDAIVERIESEVLERED